MFHWLLHLTMTEWSKANAQQKFLCNWGSTLKQSSALCLILKYVDSKIHHIWNLKEKVILSLSNSQATFRTYKYKILSQDGVSVNLPQQLAIEIIYPFPPWISHSEIPLIINYWLTVDETFLAGMGADINKFLQEKMRENNINCIIPVVVLCSPEYLGSNKRKYIPLAIVLNKKKGISLISLPAKLIIWNYFSLHYYPHH